jgi:hypothetical protein
MELKLALKRFLVLGSHPSRGLQSGGVVPSPNNDGCVKLGLIEKATIPV